jgi:hypothetical protein
MDVFSALPDLIAQGYDFDKIVQRVADLLDMSKAEVISPSGMGDDHWSIGFYKRGTWNYHCTR